MAYLRSGFDRCLILAGRIISKLSMWVSEYSKPVSKVSKINSNLTLILLTLLLSPLVSIASSPLPAWTTGLTGATEFSNPSDACAVAWAMNVTQYTCPANGNYCWSSTGPNAINTACTDKCTGECGATCTSAASNCGFGANLAGSCPPGYIFDSNSQQCLDKNKLKNNGFIQCIGNPINPGQGNKYQEYIDYQGHGHFPLSFMLHYNSQDSASRSMGLQWTPSFFNSLKINSSNTPTEIDVFRSDGRVYHFWLSGSVWITDNDISDRLQKTDTGWAYITSNETTETYNVVGVLLKITNRTGLTQTITFSDGTAGVNGGYILDSNGNQTTTLLTSGLLIRIADVSGRSLNLGRDEKWRIVKVTDPAGGIYLYGYDTNNNLTSVTYPDSSIRQYWYNEQDKTANTNQPHALTGITDKKDNVDPGTRFASYWYDAQGRTIKEEHAPNLSQGIDNYQLTYNTDGSGNPTSTVVTDPLLTQRTYNFTTVLGVIKSTGTNQPGGSGCGAAASALTYDANGNIKTRTDFNGTVTWYDYDMTRNLETTRIEAQGKPEARTITTVWHATFRLPTKITEPGRETSISYDSTSGNVLTKSIKDTASGKTRTWTYTWTYTYTTTADNTLANLLKTVDGPRTDVNDITTYSYYPNGDLKTISNALGHTTSISLYDGNGRPLTVTDPNDLVTSLTYTPRGWLQSRTVGTEATRYDYDSVGQIKRVTLPDASFITYDYDDAHRLTDIHDAQNSHIHYTLDAIGNRTREDVYNAIGALVNTRSHVFDALNRLWKDLGALNQTATYEYDANGNLTKIDGPLTTQNDVTQLTYDALNRLSTTTDGLLHRTTYQYDGLDQLTRVIDPRTLSTQYTVNALGEQSQLLSPDTGTTGSSYDNAGNLKTRTDADGKVVSYDYDALNRVTQISYNSIVTYTFSYDQGLNALGKLTATTGGSGPASYLYNSSGRLDTKTQNGGSAGTFTTRYSYYPSGQLSSMTYPSGKVIAYRYNTAGLIDAVTVDGQPLIQSVSYQPFGPVSGWQWGNNTPYLRQFDSDGRLASFPMGAANSRTLHYDDAARIDEYTDTSPAATYLLRYDAADHLTDWITLNTNQSYAYDGNSNRNQLTLGNNTYANTIGTSNNRLLNVAGPVARTYSYNNAGSLLGDGTRTYTYNGGNRLTGVSYPGGSTSYTLNALGQRTFKSGSSSTHFVYDEGGKLLGEYDPSGALIAETVYLGDLPVAVMR